MCSRKVGCVDRMSTLPPLFSALRKRRLGRPAIHCLTLHLYFVLFTPEQVIVCIPRLQELRQHRALKAVQQIAVLCDIQSYRATVKQPRDTAVPAVIEYTSRETIDSLMILTTLSNLTIA